MLESFEDYSENLPMDEEDDADSFDENEERALERLAEKSRKKGRGKQKDKVGRKSQWPTEVVDDLVEIVLESEKF